MNKTKASALALCIGSIVGLAIAQDAIPKILLIKLTQDQQNTICASEIFTQCMGFDSVWHCQTPLSKRVWDLCPIRSIR